MEYLRRQKARNYAISVMNMLLPFHDKISKGDEKFEKVAPC